MKLGRKHWSRLRPLLDYTQDRDLLHQTAKTLEELSGKVPGSSKALEARVRNWKEKLDQRKTG